MTVGLIVVVGVIDGMTRSPDVAQHVSDLGRAPGFSLPSVRDPAQRVTLADDAGHPVILNFWGSWCVPCQTEMPLLAKTARQDGGRVSFVGIDLEDPNRRAALSMMNRYATPYPSGYDPGDSVTARYGLIGTPTTVFINSAGHIIGKVQGELSTGVLQFWLEHLS